MSPKFNVIPPKDIVEFDKEELPIFDSVLFEPLIVLFVKTSEDVSVTIDPSVDNTILLFSMAVLIPEPPTISKLPPNGIVKLVDVSSPIVIVEFANFEFCIVIKALLGIFCKVLLDPLIILFVTVLLLESVKKVPEVNVVPLPMAV